MRAEQDRSSHLARCVPLQLRVHLNAGRWLLKLARCLVDDFALQLMRLMLQLRVVYFLLLQIPALGLRRGLHSRLRALGNQLTREGTEERAQRHTTCWGCPDGQGCCVSRCIRLCCKTAR